jgi:radical SAM-linked protein
VSTPARDVVQRWRLLLARGPLEGETGQREQLAAWERALAASGLPVAGMDAVPSRPRFAIAAPLGAAIPGEAELADVWLVERLPVWRVREALTASMPDGYRLLDVHDVWLGEPALPGQVAASVYRATFAPGSTDRLALESACRELLAESTLPRERPKGQATVRYDLRPFLDQLDVDAEGSSLRMTLRHDPERGIGRPEEVLAALGERLGVLLEAVSLVREGLVLAPPPPPVPAASRAGQRGRPRPPTDTIARRR